MTYPAIEPYDSGRLDVGDGHGLYWECCGNPTGQPALVLHGGPGSGCTPWHRRLFDPDRYRIILFDQRNCGRSTPHAGLAHVDLATNTTQHLVADIERVREHVGLDEWLVLGGSWGSTLALAYAESHPQRVTAMILFGVTAGLAREFDWVFRGGLEPQFPEPWRQLRKAVGAKNDFDVPHATHELLFDADAEVRRQAAYDWCLWESAIPEWPPSNTLLPRFQDPSFRLCFARIVTHYVCHNAWLADGALIEGLDELASKRIMLIDGRHDPQTTKTAELVASRLPLAEQIVVDEASHAASNRHLTAALVRATDLLGL